MCINNLRENQFGEMEGKIIFNHLNKEILVEYDKEVPFEYVKKNIEYLNTLSEIVINDICFFSLKFCNDFIKAYPDINYKEGIGKIANPKDILKYMSIDRLRIDMYVEENLPVLNLSGSCDWDMENGIQWLIKNDKVVYVGRFDDLNIWYSDLNDSICNYAYQA